MIWFAILLIYPSTTLAYYLSDQLDDPYHDDLLFHHNIPNESDKYAKELGVEGPDIPDVDGGDDKCVGRVEIIRFNTGPKIGRLRKDITSIKLNTFEHLHWTEESLIRMPLYKAYMAQSMIRIDSPRCSEPEIEFKGFTFMARGTPPPIGGLGLYLDPLHTSTYYHVEKITTPNGTLYENCYGFIQNVRVLQTEGNVPDALTVVKLNNEEVSHYTTVPHHREIILDAYLYNLEIQLLTNSCSNSEDRGFAAFRIIR